MDESASHRLKLHRARQHLQTLNTQVGSWGDKNPYAFIEEFDSQKREYVIYAEPLRQPEPMWSATVGDCLQNMRAALDTLVFALAETYCGTGRRPQDIQFPIWCERTEFRNARPRAIGRIHPRAQAIIQRLQPYRRRHDPEGHFLWMLHRLATDDRHRALHVIPGILHETDITLRAIDPPDALISYTTEINVGVLEGRTEIARTRVTSNKPDTHVYVEVSPLFGIAFEQGGTARGQPVVNTLRDIRRYIADEVVPPLERFL